MVVHVIQPMTQHIVLGRVVQLRVPIHGHHGVHVLLHVDMGPVNEAHEFGETLAVEAQAVLLPHKPRPVTVERGILVFDLTLSVSTVRSKARENIVAFTI